MEFLPVGAFAQGPVLGEPARPRLAVRYGERFCRMWEYYLSQNAAAFRCRHINVGQLVLTLRGLRGGYTSVR